MVHQHFMLVPVFTVAENVMLGREQTRGLRRAQPPRRRPSWCASCPSRYKLAVDPDALIEDLPVGVQQRVEIIKALANDAEGADPRRADGGAHAAGDRRADGHHARSSRSSGTSIVFITHKLREVKAIGDRITVIRRGKVVGTAEPRATEADAGRDDGRPLGQAEASTRRRPSPASRVLEVRNLTVIDPRGHLVVKDVSFEAHGPARSSASPASRATARPS